MVRGPRFEEPLPGRPPRFEEPGAKRGLGAVSGREAPRDRLQWAGTNLPRPNRVVTAS